MTAASPEDVLDTVERAGEGTQPKQASSHPSERRGLLPRQKAERFHFNLLSTELDEYEEDSSYRRGPPRVMRRRTSVVNKSKQSFWSRMVDHVEEKEEDPFFDMSEDHMVVMTPTGSQKVQIPTLKECEKCLTNEEAEKYRTRAVKPWNRLQDMILNVLAAFYIYLITILCLEVILVLTNTGLATYFFCLNSDRFNAKLDFAFLAFSVVFPLTFLIQATFTRREQGLSFLADFKSAVLAAALLTLSVDWPNEDGSSLVTGRLALPARFNRDVVDDFRQLIQLVYEYLSMPNISHARNVVFWSKQTATKRVHALQNDIIKQINENLYDMAMHTEAMRKYGFQSGEASRLHQYHQYIQQRFEHLRAFKYYRTPQATRSFGKAYILILPWISGPYFSWVFIETEQNYAYTIVLACFTFLVLLGLLKAQHGLEDPFLADIKSWSPGIDNVKLNFEMAVVLQTLEQYYVNAQLQRSWELARKKEQKGKEPLSSLKEAEPRIELEAPTTPPPEEQQGVSPMTTVAYSDSALEC